MPRPVLTVVSCLTLCARLFAFQSSSPATSPAAAVPFSSPSTRPTPDGSIAIKEFLVLPPVGVGGRSLVHTDAIEAIIVQGGNIEPIAGDTAKKPDGEIRTWEIAKCEPDGTLRHDALKGGYAYARVELPAAATYMLLALGHNMVYVNGVPRTGDPYSYGFVQLPVRLEAGVNHLLFSVGRGSLKAQLKPARAAATWIEGDATFPDNVDQPVGYLAIPIANTDLNWQKVEINSYLSNFPPRPTQLNIPPLTVVKPGVIFGYRYKRANFNPIEVGLQWQSGSEKSEMKKFTIRTDRPSAPERVTFQSKIDGSTQYYCVLRAAPAVSSFDLNADRSNLRKPTIVSLHGASVEATNQIASYAAGWAHIIAPTNRRPFGFDWEDWGRIDAIESLQNVMKEEYEYSDRSRVYLTGHSMGGHGTWNVGVLYPDLFAAIGPSAGWTSFWSYGNMKRWDGATPLSAVLQRAHNPSDTLAMLTNLKPRGVYILHGDADETVPVAQARDMREKLAPFHRDFEWHEQPGAGHWWDNSDEPGAACVDWPPMMDFFARHRLPNDAEVRDIDFVTPNPAISARLHWAIIEQQQHSLALSRVSLHADPHTRRIEGTTENVRRLILELPWKQAPTVADAKPAANIKLDGQELRVGFENLSQPGQDGLTSLWSERFVFPRAELLRKKDKWSIAEGPPVIEKSRRCAGPFKAAFDHCFLMVVGTSGTDAENQALLAKVRLDSETWWVRGNGYAEMITDRDFLSQYKLKDLGRNIILYGNADTNAAWEKLLSDSPVQVRRGSVRIGDRELNGENLACLFVRPFSGLSTVSIGVIAGTGAAGQRLTERLPVFVSGVAFPDVLVYSTDMLTKGDAGIRAAGFFGPDWKVETGDFGFAE